MAFADVTEEVGELCLGAFDFELDFAVRLEAGHLQSVFKYRGAGSRNRAGG